MNRSLYVLSKFCFFVLLSLVASASGTTEPISLKSDQWVSLKFRNIPSNDVKFFDGVINITVQRSAGPLVHRLAEPAYVIGFAIQGIFSGRKKVESAEWDEDSVLRVGFVAAGDRTLNLMQRAMAADWVKRLFELAPKGSGIDRIHFYTVTNREGILGKSRVHPKSDLLLENVTKVIKDPGDFDFTAKLKTPLEVNALWLSVDGDDSASDFELKIKRIELERGAR